MIHYWEYLKIASEIVTKYEEISSSSHEVRFTSQAKFSSL